MADSNRSTDLFAETESQDFIVRNHGMPVWKLIGVFGLCFAVLYGVATRGDMLGGEIGIALAIFAVTAPMAWYTVYYSQQNRDMLLAAEFQNALFSAAARLKSTFVMIVKRDGSIFYSDRGFQDSFPETRSRGALMIDKVFSSEQISRAESEKLMDALLQGRSESVYVTLKDSQGNDRQMIITIDPLPRPAGFYILRGRDYVVKQYERAALSQPAVPLSDNPYVSASMAHLMHTMPCGLYATDQEGNLTFINYRLETWLGYGQNEVLSRGLSLGALVPQQKSALLNDILERDCEGSLNFLHKNGLMVPVKLRQEICKDEAGRIIGSVGFLEQNEAIAPKPVENAAPAHDASAHNDEPQPAPFLTAQSGSTL
jgi:PAS domain S-box-containing protein